MARSCVDQVDRTAVAEVSVDKEGGNRSGKLDLMVAMENAAPSSKRSGTRTLLRHSVTSSTTSRGAEIVPVSREPRNTEIISLLLAVLCVALFVEGVSAQDRLQFNTPLNLTLCAPTNLTWSGGVPPYRLDIYPYSPDNNTAQARLDQRFVNLTTQWVIWTPNIPAGTDVGFTVEDNTDSGLAYGHHLVQLGSNTSCLPGASTTQSPSVMGSPSSSIATSTSISTAPVVFVSRHGLSSGAIAGIAASIAVITVIATAVAVWYVLRRRRQSRAFKDFDVDGPIARSSTFSNATTAVMHENYPEMGICSTLASTDRLSKAVTDTGGSPTDSRFASYSGPSSPTLDMEAGLRPTPYLFPRPSSPSGSLSYTRRSRKGVRDTAATSTNVSSSDLRSATPTQMSDTGSALPSPRIIRFAETDGGVRLAGEGVERVHHGEGADAASEAGTASAPPPYSPYQ